MVENKLSSLPLKILVTLNNTQSDIELARRVENNVSEAVDFFLNRLSRPMLEYIGKNIMNCSGEYREGAVCYSPSIYGEYYEFISSPIIGCIPQWHKLSLYQGKNGARLLSYTTTITVRYFIKIRNKELEEEKKKSTVSLQENPEVETLIKYNYFDGESLSEESVELRWAWRKLSEKDREVLSLLVIDEIPPIEAFDTLIKYVERETPNTMLTTSQKQTMMSLLKHRAKKHLLSLIFLYRKKYHK